MKNNIHLILLSFLLFIQRQYSIAEILHTNSRWIVDDNGRRVKLACVNWASHLEAVFAEGLDKQPLDSLSKQIKSMGFNCVRLTWPLFLATNDTLSSLTVRQSLQSLGLLQAENGVEFRNPTLIDLPLMLAYQKVVSNLGENDVMVILDNHISKPGWCCSNNDGNSFFGDVYFDPDLWIQGLTKMATIFNGFRNVVGMSLRNELRGTKQNLNDWYKYMQKGAEAVHSANPNVLVILSGLNFDNELGFLSNKQVEVSFSEKLIFEVHWYAFSDGNAWINGNPNEVCGRIYNNVLRRSGFLLNQGWPLFLSEFGIDERGTNLNDNRYLNCLLGAGAELDLDWAIWAFQGSYYLREGTMDLDETYGLMNHNWDSPRNASFLQRISSMQTPFQGPGLSSKIPYQLIFHPSTGLCILRASLLESPKLGSCVKSEAWIYTKEKTIMLNGTNLCLQADSYGNSIKLSTTCEEDNTRWDEISDSKMHLSTKILGDSVVCLDIDIENNIITNPCKCLRRDTSCDPDSQWFKIINSTRSIV